MKKRESLKKNLAILVILLAIALPWACTTNNTSPGPTSPGGGSTPGGATPTFTTTLVPGTTPTFTSTPSGTAPTWIQDVALSIQPNAFYCIPGTTTMMVATGGVTQGGDITMMEIYSAGSTFAGVNGNVVWVGVPTPGEGPASFEGHAAETVLKNPQGIAYSAGSWALLDSPGAVGVTGTATLYEGDNNFSFPTIDGFQEPVEDVTTSYGGSNFSNPQGLAADSLRHFYVADTGNKRVAQFGGVGYGTAVSTNAWESLIYGSNTYNFKNPVAVACDLSNNLYVGDTSLSGVTAVGPSVLMEFSAQGDAVLGTWNLIPNCVINGIAVDGNNDVYISDLNNGASGGGQVEEYQLTGFSTYTLLRTWDLSKSPNHFTLFRPSCIALMGDVNLTAGSITNIMVGDQNARMIEVFAGP